MATTREILAYEAPHNAHLLRGLADTDYAASALRQQLDYIADLTKQIDQSKAKLTSLKRKTQVEKAEHEKYRDSTMKRFAYKIGGKKDKFADRASKEEREYYEAVQEEHSAAQWLETLQGQFTDATRVKGELEAASNQHIQYQNELDAMYNKIFEGPTPDFPEEDAKEFPVHEAQRVYNDLEYRYRNESQTTEILNTAAINMKRAMLHVEGALDASRMDMLGFGGSFADLAERDELSKCQMQVMSVTHLISQAQGLQPLIQPLPNIRIAQGNFMSDIVFDNIFTDMNFHEKIKDTKMDLTKAQKTLNSQVEEAKGRQTAIKADLDYATQTLEFSRKELQQVRQQAFESVGAPPAYS